MTRNKIAIIIIALFAFMSCVTSKKVTEGNYHIENPPNGIKVAENFFCDQTEMDNLAWLEYMYWTQKVFGLNSPEFISTLPDTSVWSNTDTCLSIYTTYYLRHPAYKNYPVVGVSQQQALNFSKWRSDRVFEYLLVKFKKIKYDTAQTPETHFTIEKYFEGKLNNNISEDKFFYYPDFRLPTLTERKLVLNYSDSVDENYFDKCRSKFCKECTTNFPNFWADIRPCINDTSKIDPTTNVFSGCSKKKDNSIFNLRGNVNEWTSEKQISVGGGWHDNREIILEKDSFILISPNSWTGFRNIAQWKKWKDNAL